MASPQALPSAAAQPPAPSPHQASSSHQVPSPHQVPPLPLALPLPSGSPPPEDRVRRLYTTDRIVERKDIDVLGAKTGYTDTARYCFTAVIRTEDGRRVAFTMLGAPRNRNRWRDVDRLIDWLNAGGGR